MGANKASLFDLDHTLLVDNSSYRFGSYLFRQKVLDRPSILYCLGCYSLHKIGKLSLKSLHEKIFVRLFRNRLAEEFQAYAAAFLKENFTEMCHSVVYQRLQNAKEKGHTTVILSSSPHFLVKVFAERFGVDEWMGTVYETNKEGKFTSISTILDANAKAKYLCSLASKKEIPIQNITAYSDSFLDFSFLKAAGYAVAVNPDNKLRALCREHQWEII